MKIGQSFLEFVENVLVKDETGLSPCEVDLEKILSPLADDQDLYELMSAVPEEEINTVLSFVMKPESAGV